MSRILGFPEYNHPQALMTCDCTSLAKLLASFPDTIGSTAELTFDPVKGVKQSVLGDIGLKWRGLVGSEILECTFSFEIEAKVFTKSVYTDGATQNKVVFYLETLGPNPHFRRQGIYDGSFAWGGLTAINNPSADAFKNMEGYIPYGTTEGFVRVDYVVRCGKMTVYIDGLPVSEARTTDGVTTVGGQPFIQGINMGGANGTTAQTVPEIFYRNAQFIPQAIDLRIDPTYKRFAWIADSFGKYGDYSTAGTLKIAGNSADHFADNTDVALSTSGISGFVPVAHGRLNLAGFSPVNGRHETYYRGGGSVRSSNNKAAFRMIERMLANNIEQSGTDAGTNCQGEHGWGTTLPEVIFAIFGANDVTGAAVTNYDLIKQGWIDTIQLAVDNGCKRFIMSECAPTAKEGGVYADAQCKTNILTFNQATHDAASLFPEAFVCPVYDRFGGQENFFPEDWANDRHPAKYGEYKWGNWMADTFLESV